VSVGGTCVLGPHGNQTPPDGCCNCASWTHLHDYAGLCSDPAAEPFPWMHGAPSAGWCLSWRQASAEDRAESAARGGTLF